MAHTHPLPLFLEIAVPLAMLDLRARGYPPTDQEIQWARDFAFVLGEKGDTLQFGGKPGEAGKLAGQLAKAIAIAATVSPGGMTVFGIKFENQQSTAQEK